MKCFVCMFLSFTIPSRSPCRERGLKCRPSGHNKDYPSSLPVQGAWIEIIYNPRLSSICRSLPVQGAWIEMAPVGVRWLRALSRSPCRERGLKLEQAGRDYRTWCRSPCRERGLKCEGLVRRRRLAESLPVQGAWIEIPSSAGFRRTGWSLPVQGAWIEISITAWERTCPISRSPCRERGLKSARTSAAAGRRLSLPVQGAWIEIARHIHPPRRAAGRSPCRERGLKSVGARAKAVAITVAPRAGSVD